MKAIVLVLSLLPPAATPPKHTILFFTATWCPPCHQMKAETLSNVSLPGHELRIIDVDRDSRLGASYGISSIPAYVVLNGKGQVYRRGEGFRDVPQFVRFLNEGK